MAPPNADRRWLWLAVAAVVIGTVGVSVWTPLSAGAGVASGSTHAIGVEAGRSEATVTPATAAATAASSPSPSAYLSTPPPTTAGPNLPATMFPPNPQQAEPSTGGTVTVPYHAAPAPIGLSDFGIGPDDTPYTYTTTGFEGSVTINSLQVFTPTNVTDVGYPAPDWALLQLNTVVVNVSSKGPTDGVYWIQNGVHLNGTTLQFEDNIWNFSASRAPLPGSTLTGTLGSVFESKFYAGILAPTTVKFPFTLSLFSNVTSKSDGQTVVTFSYTLSDGGSPTKEVYDTVTFNGTQRAGSPAFRVSGSAPNAAGYLDDAELVFGGNGDGANANVVALNGTARLLRWNSTASAYRAIPAAYDFGADSSETVLGVAVSYVGTTAYLSQGPSMLEGLWNTTTGPVAPAALPGSIHVHLSVSPSYAFVFATNLTDADGPLAAADYSYAPSTRSGNLTAVLPPPAAGEPYVFRAWADGFASLSLNVTGTTSESLDLSASRGTVDAPVYLLGSGQATRFGKAKVTQTGYWASGERLWLNASEADLAAPFTRVNDVNMSTFQLVAVWDVNLSVTSNAFVQDPATFNYTTPLGHVVDLPYWTQGYFFYGGKGHFSVQNTTIAGDPNLARRYAQFPPATIQFSGTTDAAAGNVTATDDAIGVRLLGETTARVGHLTADSGAVGLASYVASGLTVFNASAAGADPFHFHSALLELNRTTSVSARQLVVTNLATGVVSNYGTGLSISQYLVLTGATALVANWTNSSQVSDLRIGAVPTGAGSWLDSTSVTFDGLSTESYGLDASFDRSLTVEDATASGPDAQIIANATGVTGATFTDIRANDTALALLLTRCSDVSITTLSATNDSTGVQAQAVGDLTVTGVSSSTESIGAYVNGSIGPTFSDVSTTVRSVGVWVTNSSLVSITDVTATNRTLGGSWNFTNSTGLVFPATGVGLSVDSGVTISDVTVLSYPYGVWSSNSSTVTIRDVVDRFGGEAVSLNLTNYSSIGHLFAFGDQLAVSIVNCTRTSLVGSVLELSVGVGLYLTNGTHVLVENNSFVANNGSNVGGPFNPAAVQAIALNTTDPAIHMNYWADRSTKTYVINPNASIKDPNPRSDPPSTYLQFTETGLPVGTYWSVTVAGVAYSTPVTMLLLPGWALSDGSLSYAVGLVAGYPAHPSSGSVDWAGANSTVAIFFGNLPSSSSSVPVWAYAAIGAGVAVAVVAVVLVIRHRKPRAPPPRPGGRGRPQGSGRPAVHRPADEWSPDDST